MRKSNATPRTAVTLHRKKFLGLTLSLLCFDSANQALAHSGAGPGWTPTGNAVTNPAHSNFVNLTRGHSTNPLTNVTNLTNLTGVTHGKVSAPTGLTFVVPRAGANTTELGQSGQNLSLDLTSTSANIVLGSKLFAGAPAVTIKVGGVQETFKAGSQVTAGEYVAIQQVLGGNAQGVTLSGTGAATGGSFSLNAVDKSNVTALVIPASVTALDYVSKNSTIKLNGDLTNYGSIDAVSTNNKVTSGTISADDITNEAGATITSQLSSISVGGANASPTLDLNLTALQNFTNSGAITSSGALTISAGNTLTNAALSSPSAKPVMQAVGNVNLQAPEITNAGTIRSVNDNINMTGSPDVAINGTGGQFTAAAGNINIGDAGFKGTANTTLTGGDYFSNNLNVYAGQGNITGSVGQVSGQLNTFGKNADLETATPTLTLGTTRITHDPTYADSTGDITIDGKIEVGESLTLIAQGNINNTTPVTISATDTVNGKPITFIAGANVTDATDSTTTSTAIPAAATVNGASSNGGNISLASGTTISTTGSNSGGNVLMVAYAGTGNGGVNGTINLAGTTINTYGGSVGTNGSVTLIANGTTPINGQNATIVTGVINTTTSGGSTTGGAVNVYTAQAIPSSVNSVSYNSDGSQPQGAASLIYDTTGANDVNGSVQINGNITSPTTITISAAGGISEGATVGTLTANTVTLEAGLTGTSYGNLGANGAPIYTAAANISANTYGQVGLSNTGTVNLSVNASSGAYISNTGPGTILESSGGNGSFNVSTTPDPVTGNGQISIAGAVTAGSQINLNSSEGTTGTQNIGGITNTAAGSLTANNVTLSDGAGGAGTNGLADIGAKNNSIATAAPVLTVNTCGNAYLSNAQATDLELSSAGGNLSVLSAGQIVNYSSISSGGKLSLVATTGDISTGASLSAGNNLYIQSQAGNVTINGALSAVNGVQILADLALTNYTSITAGGSVQLQSTTGTLSTSATVIGGTVGGSSAAVTLSAQSGLTVSGNVGSVNGSTTLTSQTGTLQIASNANIFSNNGNLTLQNADPVLGTISIGSNATLTANSATGSNSNVYIVVGSLPPNLNAGTNPGNIAVNTLNGGQVLFNNGNINTTASPSNVINASTSSVVFDNQGTNQSGISLGGGVTIAAGNAIASLDLSKPGVTGLIVDLQNAGLVGGTLTTTGGIASGGNAIVQPSQLFSTISADNVPANVTLSLQNFQSTLTVALTPASTSQQVIVSGTQQFISSGPPSNGVLTVTYSPQVSGPILVVNSGGTLSSDGNLTINVGNVSNAGTIQAANALLVSGPTGLTINAGTPSLANLTGSFTGTSVAFNAGTGNLQANVGSFGVTPSLSGNNLTVSSAASWTVGTLSTLSSTISLSSSQNLTVPYDITLSGGNITLLAGGNLNTRSIVVDSASGTAGSILLTAGLSPLGTVNNAGLLNVVGSLSASATGATGSGGTISLTAGESLFTIGGTGSGGEGITGTLTATASGSGSGGSINISGQAASTLINLPFLGHPVPGPLVNVTDVEILGGQSVSVNALGSGSGGIININVGGLTLDAGSTVSANGGTTGTAGAGGSITLAALNISVGSNASVTALGSGTASGGSINLNAVTSGVQIPEGNPPQEYFTVVTVSALSLSLANGATISADGNAHGGTVGVQATSVSLGGGSSISADSQGVGDGGSITLKGAPSSSQPFGVTFGGTSINQSIGSSISADALTAGVGGAIMVQGSATLASDSRISAYGSGSTAGDENGGTVNFQPGSTVTEQANITNGPNGPFITGYSPALVSVPAVVSLSGSNSIIATDAKGGGNGGAVTINGTATLALGALISSTGVSGGSVTVDAGLTLSSNSLISVNAVGTGGTAGTGGHVQATTLGMSASTITANSELNGDGGTISVSPPNQSTTAGAVSLTNSQISADALGTGNGGHISFSTVLSFNTPNGEATSGGAVALVGSALSADARYSGNGGTILIQGSSLSIDTASSVNADAVGAGNGGTLSFTGFMGFTPGQPANPQRGIFNPTPGSFAYIPVTLTLGSSGPVISAQALTSGNGGNITVDILDLNSGSLSMNGTSSGNGGTIHIAVANLASGTSLSATGVGTGNGGQISLGLANVPTNVTISADALGTGNGGTINASNLTLASGSFATADATGIGNGGSIMIKSGLLLPASGTVGQQPVAPPPGTLILTSASPGALSASSLGGGTAGTATLGDSDGLVANLPLGTIDLNGATPNNIGFVITGGTVNVVSAYAIAQTINFNGISISMSVSSGGLSFGSVTANGVNSGKPVFNQQGGETINPLGSAGTIALTASNGNVNVSGSLTANNNGVFPAGNGFLTQTGSISVTSGATNSITAGSITAQAVNLTSDTLNLNGSISSGSVVLQVFTPGGVTLTGAGASGLTVNMASGINISGGHFNVNFGATNGPLTVNGASSTLSGANASFISGAAMSASLSSSTAVISASGSSVSLQVNNGTLEVNSVTSTGGTILVANTSGSIMGQQPVQTEPGGGGGGGPYPGTIVSSGGNITVTAGGGLVLGEVKADSSTGNSGNVILTAAASNSGNLQINGPLSANGGVNGNGGSIAINYNDATGAAFGVGTPASLNYVDGTAGINANGSGSGNAGSIAISNTAGAPLVINDATVISASGSTTGTLTFNAPGQSVTVGGNGSLTGAVTASGSSVTIDPASGSLATSALTATSGNVSVASAGALALTGNVSSTNGSISATAATGILSVANAVILTANTGNVTLQNLDPVNGSISIGKNASISTSAFLTPGAGNVTIAVGPIGAGVVGTTPANVVVTEIGPGQVFFGIHSIKASAPSNLITAYGGQVLFTTGSLPASAISLGGNVTINSQSTTAISSLDLTNPANVAYLVSLQQTPNTGVTGTLTLKNGIASGGTLIITNPDILGANLTAEDIPKNVTLEFNYQPSTPVNVSLSSASTVNQVVLNGTMEFVGAGSNAAFNITTTNAAAPLSIGNTGVLTSQGNLTLTVGGQVVSTGQILATGNLTVNSGQLSSTGASAMLQAGANLTITASGPVTSTGQIVATTGNVLVNSGAFSSTGASAVVQAAGSVTVNASGLVNSTGILVASGNLAINALGAITVSTPAPNVISGATVSLTTNTGSNGNITVSSSINSTSTITLSADGSGTIVNTGAATTLTAPTVSLNSVTGSIGTAAAPINTQALNLTVETGGSANAYVIQTGSVNLGASGAGAIFQLTSTSGITTSGAVSAGTITLTTGANGSISIGSPIISTGTTTLTANGSGTISETASGPVQANSLILKSTSGSIGPSSALITNASSLTANTTGNANIDNTEQTGLLSLGASNIGGTFQLASGGNVTTTGVVTAPILTLTSAGAVTVNHNFGSLNGATTISSAGNVNTAAAANVQGNVLTLASSTGASFGTTAALNTAANTMTVNTFGSANISNTSVNTNLNLGASSVGNVLQLVAGGAITTTGIVTAPSVTLTAGNNTGITLGANIGAVGGVTTLTAKGAANITETSGTIIQGDTVALSDGAGTMGTGAAPLMVAANNLTLTSVNPAASADINNTAVTGNLNLGASSVGTLVLNAGGAITTTGTISSATVTLTSGTGGNINIDSTVGATNGTTTLNANGSGNINYTASQVNGNTLTLTSGSGNIGGVGALLTDAINLTVSTSGAGSVNLDNIDAALLTLANNASGGSGFQLTTAGLLTVHGITTSNGSIDVVAASGALTVAASSNISATNGSVTIENSNTGNGSISLGAGTVILGSSTTAGLGQVNIVIGPVPVTPVVGPTPANVHVTTSGGGAVFYGTKGIVASAPLNTLNAAGRNIVFNTGALAPGRIQVAGNVSITADPPGDASTSSALTVPIVALGNLGGLTLPTPPPVASSPVSIAGSTVGINAPALRTAVDTSASAANTFNLAQAVQPTNFSPTQQGLNSEGTTAQNGNLSSLQSSIVDSTTAGPATRTLYGAATEYGVPVESLFVGRQADASTFEIEAAVVAGAEMGLGGPTNKDIQLAGWTGPETNVMTLRKGNLVVAPDQDTVIETSFGQVSVAAKSMALIMALPSGTAVYNLDDTRKNSIVVTVGKNQMTLAPGRHAMITSHLVGGFEMVNPAESFAYRDLSSKKLDCDLQAFTSEFQVANAIGNIKQLRAMVNSSNPDAKRKANHMLKTAAIMSQISAGGGYQQYQHPRMTAMAVVK